MTPPHQGTPPPACFRGQRLAEAGVLGLGAGEENVQNASEEVTTMLTNQSMGCGMEIAGHPT
eukprot:4818956-Prorocentrum_lima.AAC.1